MNKIYTLLLLLFTTLPTYADTATIITKYIFDVERSVIYFEDREYCYKKFQDLLSQKGTSIIQCEDDIGHVYYRDSE